MKRTCQLSIRYCGNRIREGETYCWRHQLPTYPLPDGFALMDRPEDGVITYRSTRPGLPEDHEREHAEAWTETMACAATLGAALARMDNALDRLRKTEPSR